jgi:transcriptional regulator
MYNPPAFREQDIDAVHRFIRERRFGLLVSCSANGPLATALPLLLDSSTAPLGVLAGHLSRANAHWQALGGREVLAVFQGPDAYVTPTWYPSKAEHGKVVPTWNYVMVEARGVARIVQDRDWLHRHVTHLTDHNERGQDHPWHVSDAPTAYVEAQLGGIVGIEIAIREVDGKWKVSQNRDVADRLGVADGLARDGLTEMADLVRQKAT